VSIHIPENLVAALPSASLNAVTPVNKGFIASEIDLMSMMSSMN
jgi:hypothetical protein